MIYLFSALLLFIASVMAHIFYCRKTTKPGLQAKAFISITGIALGVYAVFVTAFSGMIDPHSLWGMPFRITAGIIFILLVPMYLCFYVLTQLTSPSKNILFTVAQEGGASYNDILSSVQRDEFLSTRLEDLCASKCVTQINGRYILTSEGQKIAFILKIMQGILGRQVGG